MKLNDENRTVIGFVIFVVFLVLGLILAQKETKEITKSDNKD